MPDTNIKKFENNNEDSIFEVDDIDEKSDPGFEEGEYASLLGSYLRIPKLTKC